MPRGKGISHLYRPHPQTVRTGMGLGAVNGMKIGILQRGNSPSKTEKAPIPEPRLKGRIQNEIGTGPIIGKIKPVVCPKIDAVWTWLRHSRRGESVRKPHVEKEHG